MGHHFCTFYFDFLNKEALHSAIHLLSRREHSQKELIQKLLTREFQQDDLTEVIEHLLAKNYLSDERYAESMIRNRVNRGYGWRFIKNELGHKGVNSSTISAALQEQDIDWYVQAELAYAKKFGERVIKDQKDKAKRIRFLQYRGFSHDEINAVLSTN